MKGIVKLDLEIAVDDILRGFYFLPEEVIADPARSFALCKCRQQKFLVRFPCEKDLAPNPHPPQLFLFPFRHLQRSFIKGKITFADRACQQFSEESR